jgi:hypothetical protein
MDRSGKDRTPAQGRVHGLGSASEVVDPTKDALQHAPTSAGLRAAGAGRGWLGGLG